MRIVIDMQGLQSMSRYRGIGRYSDAFVKAFIVTASRHEIYLLLNGISNQGADEIIREYEKLLPKKNIVVFDAVSPLSVISGWSEWRVKVSQKLREEFIYKLNPDIVLLTSLFEGVEDNSVSSIGLYRDIPTAVIFYDLIPYIYPEKFLSWTPMRKWYMDRIASLKRADLLLAISHSAAHEAKLYLDGFDGDIAVISSAVSERFAPGAAQKSVLEKFGIDKNYIMLSSAYEPRKNFEGLIEAFALLPDELRYKYQLVLVTRISEKRRYRLQKLAKEAGVLESVILTGYVSDDELLSLYRGATLFVFPSIHEGFGLPPLEAMKCGVATIVSDRSSMPEVVANPDALFDPYDTKEISKRINEYLSDDKKRRELAEYGLNRARRFNWNRVAKDALKAIEELKTEKKDNPLPPYERDRVAQTEIINAPDRISASLALKASIRNSLPLKGRGMEIKRWRVEGPFDSSYSLALLNRETARALESLGIEVALHSTEGYGDFEPDSRYLDRYPDLKRMYRKSLQISHAEADVVSRNLYPARVDDMSGRVNMLHHYAWEESGFPMERVEEFNRALDGMTTLSNHISKIMTDHGVTISLALSGCGVDHILRIKSDKLYRLPDPVKRFKFLHISSCFPRKGADILLKAYVDAFSGDDDTSLIIKTFENPHNEIKRWIEEAIEGVENPPHIYLIIEDLPDSRIKSLYEQCDVLVAPSRAEGFGLPMAEAMLCGCSVITTGWGGQLDFCDDETAWLIDYDFEYADTHFGLFDSVWAEPKVDDLSKLMSKLYSMSKDDRLIKVSKARESLMSGFRWRDVAERLLSHAQTLPPLFPPVVEKIAWVSSWNSRCGIADYSAHLIKSMPVQPKIFAAYSNELTGIDGPNVKRCWSIGDGQSLDELYKSLIEYSPEITVIQFNYGFFDFKEFPKFLKNILDRGVKVVMMMHSTKDSPITPDKKLEMISDELRRCERVLVHTPKDMNRLKDIGVVDNVTLFPHGIPDFHPSRSKEPGERHIVISYGFALPHKGLPELLEATSILINRGYDFDLVMMNSEYPLDISKELIESLKQRAKELGLEDRVEIVSEYLPEKESLERLHQADWVIFPYQDTGESSSAAVRYAIASGARVAVTPLPIFDDLRGSVYRMSGTDVQSLSDSLGVLLDGRAEDEVALIDETAHRWREEHRYHKVSQRLYNMLTALVKSEK